VYRFMMKPGNDRYFYYKKTLHADGEDSGELFVRHALESGEEIELIRGGKNVALHFVDNDEMVFATVEQRQDGAAKSLVRLDVTPDGVVERFRVEIPESAEVSWSLADKFLFFTRETTTGDGPRCSLQVMETNTGKLINTGLELDAESIRIAGVFPDGTFYFHQKPDARSDIWKLEGLISKAAEISGD